MPHSRRLSGLPAAKPIPDPIPNPKPSKPYFKPKTHTRFNQSRELSKMASQQP